MLSLRNLPLKRRLILVIMLTNAAALLLASAGFLFHDIMTFRREMTGEIISETDLLNKHSTALLLAGNRAGAQDALVALRDDFNIDFAAVYDANDRLFASFVREGRRDFATPTVAQPEGHRFAQGRLLVSERVVVNNRKIGSVCLIADTKRLSSLVKSHLFSIAMVVLAAMLLAFLLSSKLQRLVSDPFVRLAHVAQVVSNKKDFSIRATQIGNDEAGELVRAFNGMLDQIQERDRALRTANDELEKRVQERTQLLQRELVERMKTEEYLWESQRQLSTLISNLPGAAYRCRHDKERTLEFISEGIHELTGCTPAELLKNKAFSYADLIHPDDRQKLWDDIQDGVSKKRPFKLTYRIITPAREEKWVWEQGTGVFSPTGELEALEGLLTDITERKRAEEERKRAEEQLRQAQKMDAVGRLAGGVAHDFNNILTVITGYCDMLLRRTDSSEPLYKNIDEIHKAAGRASSLTRQLLAFSRKQVLQPKVLDLNEVVAGMEKMLRRLIGEDVELQTTFHQELGLVKTDPGQIEQVILNLAVNARDAMPQGGVLTIETVNVTFDAAAVVDKRNIEPGQYVMLAVSDTGFGMGESVKAHLFEPFFTTKGPGKGTGLGLATCYGIVQQSGGHISVYSEPDHGTSFKIYLPRVDAVIETQSLDPKDDALPQGKETLLMVEDECAVRELSAMVLRECGYNVLEAGNGQEGLDVARAPRSFEIDLVISDIIMPQLGGQEMVERLRKEFPGMKVLFTSGYTDDALVNHGALNRETAFLEKPFSPNQLARKVREVLDETALVAV